MVKNDFETIFNYNDIINILDVIGKGVLSREITYSIGVNDYFVPIGGNISHAKPNYGPVKSKYEIYYYRQTYCSTENLARIREKLKKQVKK